MLQTFSAFPLLRLAIEAASQRDTSAAIINAANEEAVDAFLSERIRFTDIAMIVEETLRRSTPVEPVDLDVVQRADKDARRIALDVLAEKASL